MSDFFTLANLHEIPKTDRYGVLGFPVRHSLSPQFQQAGFDALKIPAGYVRIEIPVEELVGAVAKLRELGFKGWNCTLPHKLEMLDLVDVLDDSACQLGAVNTVLHEEGKLTGFNTDGPGWVKAVREAFSVDVRDLRVMIVGTGGVGRALAVQSALEGCERLVLVNRTPEKAEALAQEILPRFSKTKLERDRDRLVVLPMEEPRIAEEIEHVDLVVNCTSIGLKRSDPPVLPARILQPHLLVYDTIYFPTQLASAAQSAGARSANGLGMLLHQGAMAFEIWTGKSAPLETMRTALEVSVKNH